MADFQEMCSTEVCASQNHEPIWNKTMIFFLNKKNTNELYKLHTGMYSKN